MEPVVFPSLRCLNDREEPDCTQSGSVFFSNSCPYYHRLLSASQEEVDLRSLSEPSPQTCCEIISQVEQFSSPHLMTYESAEMQRSCMCGQHVIPSLTNPYQPHVLNVLPGVCPSPLSLQTLPEFTPLPQELIVVPSWPNLSPFTSTPNSTFSFHPNNWVPISSPTEFFYSSLPPCSRLLVPDVQQPWSPHLVWRTAQQVIESGGQIQEEAKSEEEEQRNNATNWDKVQANKYDIQDTGVLSWLDEVSLAELLDSISPKESVKAEQNDNEEDKKKRPDIESSPFLEYLDELCSDEDFVRDVELILDTDYLDSLLFSDPQPTDCLALEKQQEMTLQEHQRYVDASISPVGSTPNAEYLDLLRELQSSRLPPANSYSITDEIPLATLLVEEPAPLQRAQAPILDALGSQFDTNPNYNGLLRNIGPEEHWTRCSLLPSIPLEEPLPTDNPLNATSRLYPNGSLIDCMISSLRLLAFPNTSLTSDFKARDNDSLVKELTATEDESKEASTSLPNLGNTQSAQTSQKPQEGTLPGDSPAFESSVSGSSEDPRTTSLKDPAPSFRAEEHHSPQNMNSRLVAIPVPADSSFVADSHADPSDPPADGDLSASAPKKLTVGTPKRLLVSKVLASSELRAGERGETKRKHAAMQKQTATKAREESTRKTFEKEEESKDRKTKLKGTTNTRRSQRLSGKEQARLIGEYTTERAEEKKPSERSAKKTAKFTLEKVYEKQRRRSSRGRQLFKREESNFEVRGHATKTAAEQFPEIGEKEHEELSGETQKLKVEGREQSEAKSPNVSIKTGPENAALTQIPREEKALSGGEGNKEGMQMSSFVRRGTRSTMTEEKGLPLPAARGEVKSSHRREMQNKLEVKKGETEALTLLVSSPMKRRRNRRDMKESREKADDYNTNSSRCKTNANKVSLLESSLHSPEVQTDSHPTKESPEKGPLDDVCDSRSVETCKKIPNLTPALSPEAQQSKVKGSETWDFYSLRSQNVSKRTVNSKTGIQESEAAKATHRPSNPKATVDVNKEKINAEEAERPSLAMSPMTRYRRDRDASEEKETETSPMKRGRWKSRAEENTDREEEQKLTSKQKTKKASARQRRGTGQG